LERERRILLLSRAPQLAPVLRSLAARHHLRFVRAADAAAAYERLAADRFAGALLDLDALGDDTDDFLQRLHRTHPELPAIGYGRMAASRPGARTELPLLSKPLQREPLERALAGQLAGDAAARRETGGGARRLDATEQELERRLSQLTTLYQIARAISESRNWTEALDYFLATLRDYLGVHGACILLWSREATVLSPRTVLAMSPADVARCVESLRAAYPVGRPVGEIHPLDCWTGGTLACTGHAGAGPLTVLPLLYRRAPLGFLVLDKPADAGASFGGESLFLQTIQTILGEEVANAVHLSRLVDLKNFNAAVLDAVESGVLTADETGAISFANRLARAILGLDAESPLALRFDDLFRLTNANGEVVDVARLVDAEAEPCVYTGELRRSDGGRVPVELRASRCRNPSDSELLLVVAFADLTMQRRLEDEARRADRLRSLGELSAAIAHEVRNPLQALSLTLSNLKDHLQPGAEPYVSVMFAEILRLDSIVGGILAFARPAPPVAAETNVVALCRRALDLAAERAARRRVRLRLDAAVRGDDGVECDEGQMVQVLLNLILNAIDASPPEGEVAVHVEPAAGALGPAAGRRGPFWRITVQDQGKGVAPEHRASLFDPFFTTKNDGTGLGLAVSAKIVAEHHGSIHVETRPGAGATFTVELPRRFEGLVLQPSR
jgi:PAS domain S-box-containing protein